MAPIIHGKEASEQALAPASLTPPGQELVNDASAVVNDPLKTLLERARKTPSQWEEMIGMLEDLGQ
jgi:hypothetical protein